MGVLDFLKKTPGLLRMGALLILGVLLLAFASSGAKKETAVSSQSDLTAYGEAMERRLEEFCSQVEGVGRAEVMLTFESGEQAEYRGSTQISTSPPRILGVTVLKMEFDAPPRHHFRSYYPQITCGTDFSEGNHKW